MVPAGVSRTPFFLYVPVTSGSLAGWSELLWVSGSRGCPPRSGFLPLSTPSTPSTGPRASRSLLPTFPGVTAHFAPLVTGQKVRGLSEGRMAVRTSGEGRSCHGHSQSYKPPRGERDTPSPRWFLFSFWGSPCAYVLTFPLFPALSGPQGVAVEGPGLGT